MKITTLVVALVLVVSLVGCNDSQKPDQRQQEANTLNDSTKQTNNVSTRQFEDGLVTTQQSLTINVGGIVNYGNGVYYFPMTKESFGKNLSVFLLLHDNWEVSGIACDIVRMQGDSLARRDPFFCDWGGVCGYFVTFREKK